DPREGRSGSVRLAAQVDGRLVRVRRGLDRGQDLLEAVGDHRREGRPGRHAAGVLMPEDANVRTADVNAPGGVMTDEVGVVTGEWTLRSELAGGTVTLRAQYKDADEWYAVT